MNLVLINYKKLNILIVKQTFHITQLVGWAMLPHTMYMQTLERFSFPLMLNSLLFAIEMKMNNKHFKTTPDAV
jgi:hypothetical protein